VQNSVLSVAAAVLLCFPTQPAFSSGRSIPKPLSTHPGNVFLAGERVVVPAPSGDAGTWRAIDYDGKLIAEGTVQDGRAELGLLPAGYFEVLRAAGTGTNRVSVGVLKGLRCPTPAYSPISSDVAMAWLVPGEKTEGIASLCSLAGINWVRDRLSWGELEPAKGQLVASNRYDYSAQIQAQAGLQILQVCHRSPSWANTNEARFPLDLRNAYDFYRSMARRWRGKVGAFEPWNEADIAVFGGHTGSEMASLQKAAYLGLKAEDPNIIACQNVFAIHRHTTLRDFQENEVWPYFDTFNLHHYESFTNYPRLYSDFRAVSAGKPLWVTECSLPVKWSGDEQLQEPSPDDLRIQSERVAITYALSLHERARQVFYFILPHFVESRTQFGLLRPDLTPRPSFLALAAVGRLLAGAEPMGKLKTNDRAINAFAFRARPDGHRAKVIVAWSPADSNLTLPSQPRACFDHFGRPREVRDRTIRLSRAPVFLVLSDRTELPLIPPPVAPKLLPGKPSPIVLQAVMPGSSLDLEKSAYNISGDRATTIPVFAYNFDDRKFRGSLEAAVSAGWTASCPPEVEILPGERRLLEVTLTRSGSAVVDSTKLRLTGDFGRGGRPVLSLQFVAK